MLGRIRLIATGVWFWADQNWPAPTFHADANKVLTPVQVANRTIDLSGYVKVKSTGVSQ